MTIWFVHSGECYNLAFQNKGSKLFQALSHIAVIHTSEKLMCSFQLFTGQNMDGMNNTYNVTYVSEHVYLSLIILHVIKDIRKDYSTETGHNQLKSHKINSDKTD